MSTLKLSHLVTVLLNIYNTFQHTFLWNLCLDKLNSMTFVSLIIKSHLGTIEFLGSIIARMLIFVHILIMCNIIITSLPASYIVLSALEVVKLCWICNPGTWMWKERKIQNFIMGNNLFTVINAKCVVIRWNLSKKKT